jgi:hypothetical protein
MCPPRAARNSAPLHLSSGASAARPPPPSAIPSKLVPAAPPAASASSAPAPAVKNPRSAGSVGQLDDLLNMIDSLDDDDAAGAQMHSSSRAARSTSGLERSSSAASAAASAAGGPVTKCIPATLSATGIRCEPAASTLLNDFTRNLRARDHSLDLPCHISAWIFVQSMFEFDLHQMRLERGEN